MATQGTVKAVFAVSGLYGGLMEDGIVVGKNGVNAKIGLTIRGLVKVIFLTVKGGFQKGKEGNSKGFVPYFLLLRERRRGKNDVVKRIERRTIDDIKEILVQRVKRTPLKKV